MGVFRYSGKIPSAVVTDIILFTTAPLPSGLFGPRLITIDLNDPHDRVIASLDESIHQEVKG